MLKLRSKPWVCRSCGFQNTNGHPGTVPCESCGAGKTQWMWRRRSKKSRIPCVEGRSHYWYLDEFSHGVCKFCGKEKQWDVDVKASYLEVQNSYG